MCGWPNTSDPALTLLASLHHQPLLVVLRAEQPLDLEADLERLSRLGVRHVELAWTAHPHWTSQVRRLVACFPDLQLGAASLCLPEAVAAAAEAGLTYGVSPVLDADLLLQARQCQLALVPGVMTPTEVHRARQLGCLLVKLFPAASFGPHYWSSLRQPLGGLPACIAAGGLSVQDVRPWIEAGVDAVALGGRLSGPEAWDQLAALLSQVMAAPLHQRLH
jgi:2-dehydro-3-deoxyphosphogluconate aldolase/(4S)-4-hydroxy-2-oxoglutarate aldolase